MSSFIQKKSLCDLVDSSAEQTKKLINGIDAMFGMVDWDGHFKSLKEKKDSLLQKGNSLMEEMNSFLSQVKESGDDYKVFIPYDKDGGEKIKYSIDPETRVLKVTVSFDDGQKTKTNITEMKIPEGFSIEDRTVVGKRSEKRVTFTFPKIEINVEDEEDIAQSSLDNDADEEQVGEDGFEMRSPEAQE